MKPSILSSFAVIAAAAALTSPTAHAAMTASDNAANYTTSWGTSPPNNGTGFGAWNVIAANNNNPPYVGTYLDSGSAILTGGYSFGTYANGGNNNGRIDFYRPFGVNPAGYQDPSGLGTLYNQTFSVALASDGVGDGAGGPPSSAFGFSLQSGQGVGATAVMTLEYAGTQPTDNLVLTDNRGTDNTAVPVNFSNLHGGLLVSVSVGGNPDGVNPYTITISPFAGGPAYYTFSGSTTGPIQQVDVFDSNTTGNGYFNSLGITAEVPEPGTISLLGTALAGLVCLRRRK